jgi:hypothetical protein
MVKCLLPFLLLPLEAVEEPPPTDKMVDQVAAVVLPLGLVPQAKVIMDSPAAAAAAAGALRPQGLMVGTAIYLRLQVQQFIMAAEVEV